MNTIRLISPIRSIRQFHVTPSLVPSRHFRPRTFISTTPLLKKKQQPARTQEDSKDQEGDKNSLDVALDFEKLQNGIKKSLDAMSQKLAGLRAGGRLGPSSLEGLPVKLDDSQFNLKDIAQIVTKGQYLHVILSDEAHIKAAKSSILGSDLSLAPQGPTPDAPTTLTVKIPAKTGQDRQEMGKDVKKFAEYTLEMIRKARHDKHEELKKLKSSKALNPDDFQKAHKEMERVVQKGNDEVKKLSDAAKLAI